MRILFVSSWKPITAPAYEHRIMNNEKHCRQLGADTSRLFMWKLFFGSPVLIQPLNIPFILRYLRKFDIIIAEGTGSAFVLVFAKVLLGSKTLLIYDMHNDALAESRYFKKGLFDLAGYFMGFEMRLNEYIGFNGFDYFSVASYGLKQRILDRKSSIREEHVEVVLNGVDLESFKLQEEALDDSFENGFTVTYAGSYAKYQGIENIVKAAELLSNEKIHFKFMGFRKEDLIIKHDIISRLKEKASCLDWLPKGELLSELRKSDILISPSAGDTERAVFPVKFAEYLALAKPVIVTKIDETSSIVEKFNCGYVCESTAESIADTILKAKGTSRKVLALKGSNGRRFAEDELDIKVVCSKYLKFLSRILQQRSFRSK